MAIKMEREGFMPRNTVIMCVRLWLIDNCMCTTVCKLWISSDVVAHCVVVCCSLYFRCCTGRTAGKTWCGQVQDQQSSVHPPVNSTETRVVSASVSKRETTGFPDSNSRTESARGACMDMSVGECSNVVSATEKPVGNSITAAAKPQPGSQTGLAPNATTQASSVELMEGSFRHVSVSLKGSVVIPTTSCSTQEPVRDNGNIDIHATSSSGLVPVSDKGNNVISTTSSVSRKPVHEGNIVLHATSSLRTSASAGGLKVDGAKSSAIDKPGTSTITSVAADEQNHRKTGSLLVKSSGDDGVSKLNRDPVSFGDVAEAAAVPGSHSTSLINDSAAYRDRSAVLISDDSNDDDDDDKGRDKVLSCQPPLRVSQESGKSRPQPTSLAHKTDASSKRLPDSRTQLGTLELSVGKVCQPSTVITIKPPVQSVNAMSSSVELEKAVAKRDAISKLLGNKKVCEIVFVLTVTAHWATILLLKYFMKQLHIGCELIVTFLMQRL